MKYLLLLSIFIATSCVQAKVPTVPDDVQRNFWHAAAEYNAKIGPFKASEAAVDAAKKDAEKYCADKYALQSEGAKLICVPKPPAPKPEPKK